jgi:hypothetical protein
MATPINTFRTVTANLITGGNTIIYTAPPITSTIILMAQVTNVGNTTERVTASHYDGTSVTTELVTANASANAALKLTLSLLETK